MGLQWGLAWPENVTVGSTAPNQQDPNSGTDCGGCNGEIAHRCKAGKPLKSDLRTADDLPIFNKFHRSTRVRTDQD